MVFQAPKIFCEKRRKDAPITVITRARRCPAPRTLDKGVPPRFRPTPQIWPRFHVLGVRRLACPGPSEVRRSMPSRAIFTSPACRLLLRPSPAPLERTSLLESIPRHGIGKQCKLVLCQSSDRASGMPSPRPRPAPTALKTSERAPPAQSNLCPFFSRVALECCFCIPRPNFRESGGGGSRDWKRIFFGFYGREGKPCRAAATAPANCAGRARVDLLIASRCQK